MSEKVYQTLFQNKHYYYEWGTEHLTFTQFIDNSKAAWCPEDACYYWLYFYSADNTLSAPVHLLKMSDSEIKELEYHDIISDLTNANNRGMFPEVSKEIHQLLIERNIRREVVFTLNSLDPHLIPENKGIIYIISRRAIDLLHNGKDVRTAISIAVNTF